MQHMRSHPAQACSSRRVPCAAAPAAAAVAFAAAAAVAFSAAAAVAFSAVPLSGSVPLAARWPWCGGGVSLQGQYEESQAGQRSDICSGGAGER